MRTIAEIDRDLDAIHEQMKRRYPNLRRSVSAASWQKAWDAEPAMRAQETALYRERGEAQAERDRQEAEAERRQRRSESAKHAAQTRKLRRIAR